MSDHPPSALLEKFLRGESTPEEIRPVVAHLVSGCAQCRSAMRPTAEFLLDLEAAEQDEAWLDFEVSTEEASVYDAALDRAFASIRLHGKKALKRKAKVRRALELLTKRGMAPLSTRQQGRYPLYEALLTRSWQLRHDNPHEMVHLACCATLVAVNLDRDGFAPEQVADFQARAFAEYGNALRVAERLSEAEKMLARADGFWKVGTGDAALGLRLLDLRASLLGTQHRYREAVELLERLVSLHLERDDRHSAGRALIGKGLYAGYSGDQLVAIDLIEEGLLMIDPGQDPGLSTIALHNQLWFMVDAGLLEQALKDLQGHRENLLSAGGRLDRAKLLWTKGRIYAGLAWIIHGSRAK